MPNTPTYFDKAAAAWDDNPTRVALAKGVGEAILHTARPTKEMDVLDYGCGTGLVGLFLLPHVHSVTGADSSDAMLEVLRKKINDGRLANLKTLHLDLQCDPMPKDRYHSGGRQHGPPSHGRYRKSPSRLLRVAASARRPLHRGLGQGTGRLSWS